MATNRPNIESTVDDGNCAYNAFILAIIQEPLLTDSISFPAELREKLAVQLGCKPTDGAIKNEIQGRRKKEKKQLQIELQPVIRSYVATKLAPKNTSYRNDFQERILKPAFYAFVYEKLKMPSIKVPDDFIARIPAILIEFQKMFEVIDFNSEESLDEKIKNVISVFDSDRGAQDYIFNCLLNYLADDKAWVGNQELQLLADAFKLNLNICKIDEEGNPPLFFSFPTDGSTIMLVHEGNHWSNAPLKENMGYALPQSKETIIPLINETISNENKSSCVVEKSLFELQTNLETLYLAHMTRIIEEASYVHNCHTLSLSAYGNKDVDFLDNEMAKKIQDFTEKRNKIIPKQSDISTFSTEQCLQHYQELLELGNDYAKFFGLNGAVLPKTTASDTLKSNVSTLLQKIDDFVAQIDPINEELNSKYKVIFSMANITNKQKQIDLFKSIKNVANSLKNIIEHYKDTDSFTDEAYQYYNDEFKKFRTQAEAYINKHANNVKPDKVSDFKFDGSRLKESADTSSMVSKTAVTDPSASTKKISIPSSVLTPDYDDFQIYYKSQINRFFLEAKLQTTIKKLQKQNVKNAEAALKTFDGELKTLKELIDKNKGTLTRKNYDDYKTELNKLIQPLANATRLKFTNLNPQPPDKKLDIESFQLTIQSLKEYLSHKCSEYDKKTNPFDSDLELDFLYDNITDSYDFLNSWILILNDANALTKKVYDNYLIALTDAVVTSFNDYLRKKFPAEPILEFDRNKKSVNTKKSDASRSASISSTDPFATSVSKPANIKKTGEHELSASTTVTSSDDESEFDNFSERFYQPQIVRFFLEAQVQLNYIKLSGKPEQVGMAENAIIEFKRKCNEFLEAKNKKALTKSVDQIENEMIGWANELASRVNLSYQSVNFNNLLLETDITKSKSKLQNFEDDYVFICRSVSESDSRLNYLLEAVEQYCRIAIDLIDHHQKNNTLTDTILKDLDDTFNDLREKALSELNLHIINNYPAHESLKLNNDDRIVKVAPSSPPTTQPPAKTTATPPTPAIPGTSVSTTPPPKVTSKPKPTTLSPLAAKAIQDYREAISENGKDLKPTIKVVDSQAWDKIKSEPLTDQTLDNLDTTKRKVQYELRLFHQAYKDVYHKDYSDTSVKEKEMTVEEQIKRDELLARLLTERYWKFGK